ncbi:MucR family transcriptional regulator [Sphingomonas montana]|uniref:MucR family transcriptional regulator n=1 Tax=Sphingomonas montana TaxID=1843236 RepID=UPI00096E235C|nr:MucR family transcriptional regulator [Sphingomonas montana]
MEPTYEAAVSIKKSLANPNRIISMIDGRGYSSLKRHLSTHGLTLTQYKEQYGLPANYPSVAPGYSERRRAISLEAGLGRKKTEPVAAAKPAVKKPGRKSAVERLRDAKASSPMSQD